MADQVRGVSLAPLREPLIAAIAYYLAAEAAFAIGTLSDKIFAPFWPPNVVFFCALLLTPYSRWWLHFIFVFIAHVIAEVGIGMASDQLLLAFATNAAIAVLNAVTLRHLVVGPPWFDEFDKVWRYIVLTAGLNPAIVAFGGALVPIVGGSAPEHYWSYWGHWYGANALACLTLGPIILVWRRADLSRLRLTMTRHRAGAIAAGLLLAGISVLAFEISGNVGLKALIPVILYAPLPLVLWMSVRYGAKGASSAILIVTVVLVSHTLRYPSPFNDDDPESNVLALQLFLTGLSIPVLLLSAVVDELRRAEVTMRGLAHAVLRERDEERRNVARDLHERTSQNLVYASLLLTKVERLLPEAERPVVRRIDEAIQQSVADLRSVSYLLHPPLLDEAGLPLALRTYVNGYSDRHDFSVQLDIADDFERISDETELALFRIVQEALSLFGRHSVDKNAHIQLRHDPESDEVILTLEYEDRLAARRKRLPAALRGMVQADAPGGIPLTNIRERLRQIGGRLEVTTVAHCTIVSAIVPVTPASARVSMS